MLSLISFKSLLESLPKDLLIQVCLFLNQTTIYSKIVYLSSKWNFLITDLFNENDDFIIQLPCYCSSSLIMYEYIISKLKVTVPRSLILNVFTSNFNLRYLTKLDCIGCTLKYLPVLPPILRYLNCSANELQNIPSLPNSLQVLNCAWNQLIYLPILPPNLIELRCFGNKINVLPSLPFSLIILYTEDNNLSLLPELPINIKELYCDRNPIVHLPIIPPNLLFLSTTETKIEEHLQVSIYNSPEEILELFLQQQ